MASPASGKIGFDYSHNCLENVEKNQTAVKGSFERMRELTDKIDRQAQECKITQEKIEK